MDIGMPRMDRLEAARRIKAHSDGTSVIPRSVVADEAHRQAADASRPDTFLPKNALMSLALGGPQGAEYRSQAMSCLNSLGRLRRTKKGGGRMKHFASEEWIDFSNQMVPASGQLATEKHLEEGCKRCTQTVSRWQLPDPLFDNPEIRRSTRMGFLEQVVLSLKSISKQSQNSLSLLQLLIELAITLLIAGIVVPSLLRAGVATNESLAGGSLNTVTVIGVTVSYTYKNVGFAILGALVGAAAAFAFDSPATTPNTTTPRPVRKPR